MNDGTLSNLFASLAGKELDGGCDELMGNRPSFEIAAAATSRLDARFGAETPEQPQRLAEMRLLAMADPDAVIAATVRACRRWTRRPTVDELGQLLRDELHDRVTVRAVTQQTTEADIAL